MFEITIPATEYWDSKNQEFVYTKEQTLRLEHSLVSLARWESKWCKPFISDKGLNKEEIIDYIKCMTITQNVDDQVYNRLTPKHINQIRDYMELPMTATTFTEHSKGKSRSNSEMITAEIIYYWMIALNIPMECQKWHLNRLLTLVRVCNIKNQPPKKMSKREILSRNAALNAARRQQLNSKG